MREGEKGEEEIRENERKREKWNERKGRSLPLAGHIRWGKRELFGLCGVEWEWLKYGSH